MIHLDSSFMILALIRGSAQDRKLRQWLQQDEVLAMSAVAWAEMLCGPLPVGLLDVATRIVSERVPFQEEEAQLSARLFNESGRRRGSFVDCVIAATALRVGARLATANLDDFLRFKAARLSLLDD
jgi:predicted nucleic acid-binding protein